MSDVLQAVVDYVKAPDTDYALMITGPWGCGKTYFWEKVLVPSLKALRHPHKPLRLLYVSMYGVSDTRDLDRVLFTQSYPGIAHKRVGRISKLVGGVVEALGYADLAKVDLRNLVRTDGAIICFDDLERADMPIRTALGYINAFVEHDRLKTIVLCNEKTITEETATWDEKERETYDKMKEKVVGLSLAFRSDLDAVLSSLIEGYKKQPAFRKFLHDNAELIRTLFERSKTHNIRALRRAINSVAVIFSSLLGGGIDPGEMAGSILYPIMPTALELHGNAVSPEKLRDLHAHGDMTTAAAVGLMWERDGGGKSYAAIFAKRYLDGAGFRETTGCPVVVEYLVTGFLDREGLLAHFRELLVEPDEKQQQRQKLFWDFRELSDQEFQEAVDGVLDNVRQGEFKSLEGCAQMFDRLLWLSEEKLIPLSGQELLQTFQLGVKKAEKENRLESHDFLEAELNHPDFATNKPPSITFRTFILDTNERVGQSGDVGLIREVLGRLEEAPKDFLDAISSEGEESLRRVPVFHVIEHPEEFADRIAKWPNNLRVQFYRALEIRYEKAAISEEFTVELPVLNAIRTRLSEHLADVEQGDGAISLGTYNLKWIDTAFGKAIETLQALTPATTGEVGDPNNE